MENQKSPSYSGAIPDVPPPPYSEYDHPSGHAEQSPQYEASYTANSTTLHAATRKIPPILNGYLHWTSTKDLYLGPSAQERLYAVSIQTAKTGQQTIVLHDGPTDRHPPLGKSESDGYLRAKYFLITLPPRSGSGGNPVIEQIDGVMPYKRMAPTFSFTVSGAEKRTTREVFQWRSSHGKEIKELGGFSYGWKLVRLSHSTDEAGASRSHRPLGCTSDGKEIVAVIAHNSSWSLTKGFRFAFMGSGLTGTMGEKWETMALVSAVQLWCMDYQSMVHTTPVT
ncbi:hypothetical protein BDV25DRAFT_137182 [Aspergillus avenaceus]|uniref:Tubby C-terminal-like domain-containing protein n=1 Tax=Aspergillus avenaceus TaxID=36643 RepID=A0A5N6U3V7_ASPAV|nr:hypothetical protein BDV25DRAFT_137182 [Aspergillus avenaceus]